MFAAVTISGGLRSHKVGMHGPVAISVHCEFERLHAVVLRQEGGEGAERKRWWCRVGENVPE